MRVSGGEQGPPGSIIDLRQCDESGYWYWYIDDIRHIRAQGPQGPQGPPGDPGTVITVRQDAVSGYWYWYIDGIRNIRAVGPQGNPGSVVEIKWCYNEETWFWYIDGVRDIEAQGPQGESGIGETGLYRHFVWELLDGVITIVNYIGPGGALTIPSTIREAPVTTIGWAAFMNSRLTNVVIPDSVITIGADVTLGSGAFGDGFEDVYNNAGRPAGIWTRPEPWSWEWTQK